LYRRYAAGQRKDEGANEYGLEYSLSELGQLADTAGLEVVGSLTQRMHRPHPGTYVGKGKLAELRRMCGLPDPEDYLPDDDEEEEYDDWEERGGSGDGGDGGDDDEEEEVAAGGDAAMGIAAAAAAADDGSWGEEWNEGEEEEQEEQQQQRRRPKLTKKEWESQEPRVDTVIFDSELSPRQARNLTQVLDGKVQVCDRTMLILDIFSQRARTAEGQLQVEMAQLEYQLPRLSKMWTHLERQAGGSGGAGAVKGMGEKQIEIGGALQVEFSFTHSLKPAGFNP
jgi:GTP-binding protein HflX